MRTSTIVPFLAAGALASAMLLGACSNTTAVRTSDAKYAGVSSSSVQILTTMPDRPYEELGTLNTSGWKQKDTKKLYDEFRREASKWGADAVVVTERGVTGRSDDQWVNAVAVRFRDEAPGTPESDESDG